MVDCGNKLAAGSGCGDFSKDVRSWSATSSVISSDDCSISSLSCASELGNLDLFQPISLKGWRYRGEGGANLVLSLPDRRTVVRFSKSKYVDKDHDSKVLAIAHYANGVMKDNLGIHFVHPHKVFTVQIDEVLDVKSKIQAMRPPNRCHKDIAGKCVIVSHDCVFLTEDHLPNTDGDTICVEIKPKQGYLAMENVDLCHRCLKQHANFHSGKIQERSDFCPLDLFSGDVSRMKKAIFDLFDKPQNFFRIFKNGNLMYTDNHGSKETTLDYLKDWIGVELDQALNYLATILVKCLLSEFSDHDNKFSIDSSMITTTSKFQGETKRCNPKSQGLPKDCVLSKLLKVQKVTEINEMEAKDICDKLLNHTKANIEELHQVLTWYGVSETGEEEEEFPQFGPLVQPCLTFSSSDFVRLKKLQRFLLSVTAKDISLLLTFRKITSNQKDSRLPEIAIPELGYQIRPMISVIDLDPKPVNRIKTWVRRTEERLSFYNETRE